jgi:hypothetical protein
MATFLLKTPHTVGIDRRRPTKIRPVSISQKGGVTPTSADEFGIYEQALHEWPNSPIGRHRSGGLVVGGTLSPSLIVGGPPSSPWKV